MQSLSSTIKHLETSELNAISGIFHDVFEKNIHSYILLDKFLDVLPS